MSIKQKAMQGVKWTALSSGVLAFFQLVQLMVLARYLTPHDFGLIAILGVITSFSQLFVDFGLSKSIIYKQSVTNEQLSSLYWFNVLVALFIYCVILISSSFIAEFYHESSLSLYINLMSTILIIQSFGQQFRTLFQKELYFNILAKLDIFSVIISFFTLIVLILYNVGIMAFIVATIVMVAMRTILLIINGIKYHKPQFVFNLFEIKEFLRFGLFSVGNDIISTITGHLDVIIIGKLLGTESLGIYNIMKELILRPAQLINPIITKVSFPTMAKFNHDLLQVKKIYLKVINYVASINFPIYIISIIFAQELVDIFLGEKWLPYISIFQILAIWALFRSIGNPVGSLIMALGKPHIEMYWNMLMVLYIPIQVYISSYWGIIGIAWGNVFNIFFLFIPGWYFLLYKVGNIYLREYIYSFTIPLGLSFIFGLITYLLVFLFTNIFYKLFFLVIGIVCLIILYKKYNYEVYNLLMQMFYIKKDNDN